MITEKTRGSKTTQEKELNKLKAINTQTREMRELNKQLN